MFPAPNHVPARLGQSMVYALITLDVSVQLLSPELRVLPRVGCVLRASVPKATINEHSDVCAGKRDVDTNPHFLEVDAVVLPKPMAAGMQLGPQLPLRCGVASAVRFH